MATTEGSNIARWSQSQKSRLSSDWSLQLDSMKSESPVIAHQNGAVNTFPALYTPPVTPRKLAGPEVVDPTPREGGANGLVDDWGEVVTR